MAKYPVGTYLIFDDIFDVVPLRVISKEDAQVCHEQHKEAIEKFSQRGDFVLFALKRNDSNKAVYALTDQHMKKVRLDLSGAFQEDLKDILDA